MKADSILSVLYATLAVLGVVLLWLSIGADDIIDAVVGMGSVMFGILGLEAHDIKKSIKESREVR